MMKSTKMLTEVMGEARKTIMYEGRSGARPSQIRNPNIEIRNKFELPKSK